MRCSRHATLVTGCAAFVVRVFACPGMAAPNKSGLWQLRAYRWHASLQGGSGVRAVPARLGEPVSVYDGWPVRFPSGDMCIAACIGREIAACSVTAEPHRYRQPIPSLSRP